MTCNIWFNHGFSSLYNVLNLIRSGDQGKRIRLLCSHSTHEFVGFAAADAAFVEPAGLDDQGYLSYCLDFCHRESINLFIPTRKASFLSSHEDRFAALGTLLHTTCPPDSFQLTEHKGSFYDLCCEKGLPVPEYRVVSSCAEFDEAHRQLRTRHPVVCFKPCVSIFGLGFRILCESGREIDRLLSGENYKIGVNYARTILAEGEPFRPLMVMQYLEGEERSVDCLSDHGKLLRCVVRLKSSSAGGAEILEDNPEIEALTAPVVSLFRLNGLCNVQFRSTNGIPYLLEVNTRMAGGIHFGAYAGLNLPYWGASYALGHCGIDDIPFPTTGAHVAKVDVGVVVS